VAEVMAGRADDPARLALERGFGLRTVVPAIPTEVLEWGLGAGESSVIALAHARRDATVILDDAEARSCTRALGVAVMGTLGVVLRGKRLGRIDSAAAVIRELRRVGLHVEDRVIGPAIAKLAGERWEP
jgi:predicted nucleic acid-binding protein